MEVKLHFIVLFLEEKWFIDSVEFDKEKKIMSWACHSMTQD